MNQYGNAQRMFFSSRRSRSRATFAIISFVFIVVLQVAALSAGTQKPTEQLTNDQKISLVLNRLAFGPRPGDIDQVRKVGLGVWINQQLHPEQIDDSNVDAQLTRLENLDLPSSDLMTAYKEDTQRAVLKAKQASALQVANIQTASSPAAAVPSPAPADQRMLLLQAGSSVVGTNVLGAAPTNNPGLVTGQTPTIVTTPAGRSDIPGPTMMPGTSTEALGELEASKVLRAVDSNRQLQEVLVDFWSNHFNLDVNKGPVRDLILADERDVIRPHVLGRFRDLLEASAKSPAMLWYLDNYQSTKNFTPGAGAPAALRRNGLNENYGRELMELHTLGVDGGYTQHDVTEVARCFTGWSIDRDTGEFRFYPRRHDDGEKIVLGQIIAPGGGIQDGETVLDILASSPSCARFISKELCERLVSDDPPDALVAQAAATFIRTQGDLREVVRTIVTSSEFYTVQTYNAKIKSPFEFAVSAVRAVNGHYLLPDPDNQQGRGRLLADAGVSMRRRSPRYGSRIEPSMIQDIADMGQPLFSYEFPTGYPEISSRWISSGGLLARFNFATALGAGQIAEVSDSPAGLLGDTPLSDHLGVLHRLVNIILHGEISPSTRSAILQEMPATGDVDPGQIAALLIGSPEFQHR